MAAIEEKKDKVSEKATAKKALSTGRQVVKKATVAKKTTLNTEHSDIAYKVLVEPWITEKTHKAIAEGKYTFKVTRNATKKQVKKAIEGMYKVEVEKINVVNIIAKKKAYGRHMGKKAGFKKATVTLKQDDKIELFQGA